MFILLERIILFVDRTKIQNDVTPIKKKCLYMIDHNNKKKVGGVVGEKTAEP